MNKVKYIIMLVLCTFIFSGCLPTFNYAVETPKGKSLNEKKVCKLLTDNKYAYNACEKELHIEHIIARGHLTNWGMTHIKYNNSNRAVMQLSAMATIHKKKKFFAIISPLIVDNTSGALNNTLDEFLKKCDVNILNVFGSIDPCGIHDREGSIAKISIALFDKEQLDFLTYDAQKVIKELEKNNDYDDFIKEDAIFENVRTMNMKSFKAIKREVQR